VFFMVQLMEAWFLTEIDTLAEIYGKNFDATKLPAIPTHPKPARPGENLEAISKEKILEGLEKATDGRYERHRGKTRVAPRMLEKMSLQKIADVSFHANRLLDRLESI
ncbi:MAG: DUF4276 family protein, partial [bacterium]